MLKKITIIFLSFFVNTVLLAHTIIPHHHHKTEICIENSECNNDFETHKHKSNEHNHDNNNSENCVLKQIVVIPSNHIKHQCKCFECDDVQNEFNGDFAILSELVALNYIPQLNSIYQYANLFSSYSKIINSSLGLRAPPTI